MRHHKQGKKLGRERNQRKALLKALAVSLFRHGKIKTTGTKAKALRPYVEKLITNAKKETIASKRNIVSKIGSSDSTTKLFKEIAPLFKDRKGGYTRITKIAPRGRDASPMAIIELVK